MSDINVTAGVVKSARSAQTEAVRESSGSPADVELHDTGRLAFDYMETHETAHAGEEKVKQHDFI